MLDKSRLTMENQTSVVCAPTVYKLISDSWNDPGIELTTTAMGEVHPEIAKSEKLVYDIFKCMAPATHKKSKTNYSL